MNLIKLSFSTLALSTLLFAGNYKIDSSSTKASFLVKYLNNEEIKGEFGEITGSFVYDDKKSNVCIEFLVLVEFHSIKILNDIEDIAPPRTATVPLCPFDEIARKREEQNEKDPHFFILKLKIMNVKNLFINERYLSFLSWQ